MIKQTKELIKSYVEKDPTKFCTYEEFLTGADTLEKFCLLRAESVKAQLEGIIGTTTLAQKETESSLIDGSNVNLKELGSMGEENGGFGFGDFNKSERKENFSSSKQNNEENNMEPDKNLEDFNDMLLNFDEENFNNMKKFDRNKTRGKDISPTTYTTETIIISIISFIILIIGIMFVKMFNRYNRK